VLCGLAFEQTAKIAKDAKGILLLLPARFLRRNLRALFSRFRESDGDRLLATLHFAAFAALSRLQRSAFLPAHCALHALACGFSVLATTLLACWHVSSWHLDIALSPWVAR